MLRAYWFNRKVDFPAPGNGKNVKKKIENKETVQCLLNEADWVYIGNSNRDGKNMLELEFRFELAEKLKKTTI